MRHVALSQEFALFERYRDSNTDIDFQGMPSRSFQETRTLSCQRQTHARKVFFLTSRRPTTALVTSFLVVILQLVTGPIETHLLGRAVYRRLQPELDGVDELARDERSR